MKLYPSTLATALSGLQHAVRTLQVSAHNIANLRTSGFKGQRSVAMGAHPSGVTTIVETPTIPGSREPSFEEVSHPAQGPEATQEVKLDLNLDPTTSGSTAAGPDAADFETEISVFDSRGNSRQVTFSFVKDGDGQWTWTAKVSSDDLAGGAPEGDVVIGQGTVGFSPEGKLKTESGDPLQVQFEGASPQEIDVDFGDSLETDGGAGEGSTGYVGGSRVKTFSRDGHGASPELHTIRESLVETSNVDPLTETMNRKQALDAYQANIAVVRTADEMTETVLDLLA